MVAVNLNNVDPNPADKGPNPEVTIGGLTQFAPNDFVSNKGFRPLRYPLSINSKQDRIFISQIEYKRTGVVQREGDLPTIENSIGSVTLPMPNDISETNSVGWGEDSLSNIAAGAMGALGKIAASVADTNFGEASEGLKELSTFAGGKGVGTRARQFLTVKAAAGIVGKLGIQVNPEAFITRSTGAAINPNLELLFNGPKLRQFAFQFKMTPRSQKEATEIRTIIRFFKQGMSPRKGSKDTSSFFLGTPNVFKIQFKPGNGDSELKSIGKIKTCALVSFAVNYTPDGFYAAYEDSVAGGSQPVAVTMQLGFTELTPIFNDEYNDVQDDIGPNNFPKADLIPSSTTPTTPTEPNGVRPGGGRPPGTTPTPPGGGSSTKSETIGTDPRRNRGR